MPMSYQRNPDIKGIIKRRWRLFAAIFFGLWLLTIVVAFALPPVYRAASTILIEGQQIPEEYVKTTITSYVEERLQVITQQIMRRSKLLEIINRFDLYGEMRDRYTTETVIETMREAIQLEPISAEVIDRRTGRPSTATIAFEVSYEGKNPATVYRVANVLASLYLEENLRAREEQATTTTAFLSRELEETKELVDQLERQLSRFKERHFGELPEFKSLNIQTLEQLNRDVDRLNSQIRALQERKIYLEGQLLTVDPVVEDARSRRQDLYDPQNRLQELRLELIAILARVSDEHPDVKRLRSEIAELESQVGTPDGVEEKQVRLAELQAQLSTLLGRYGEEHPDVVKLTRQIEALEAEIRKGTTGSERPGALARRETLRDNPAYINLETQLASTQLEINSLEEEREQIREKIRLYQKRMERSPLVEREYLALTRDHENAQRRYNELLQKLNEAKFALGMEETQSGERFTILEPAQEPERPHRPNRVALILVGFVLAFGAGTGAAAARENLDRSVKNADDLADLTDVPVLTAFPLVQTREERRKLVLRRLLWTVLLIGAVAGALVLVHTWVMPLDILWLKVQRRLLLAIPA